MMHMNVSMHVSMLVSMHVSMHVCEVHSVGKYLSNRLTINVKKTKEMIFYKNKHTKKRYNIAMMD